MVISPPRAAEYSAISIAPCSAFNALAIQDSTSKAPNGNYFLSVIAAQAESIALITWVAAAAGTMEFDDTKAP